MLWFYMRKTFCFCTSKSVSLTEPLFYYRTRERSSWFWMGRPSRSWEEPMFPSTCLMASMVFIRPLHNATSFACRSRASVHFNGTARNCFFFFIALKLSGHWINVTILSRKLGVSEGQSAGGRPRLPWTLGFRMMVGGSG